MAHPLALLALATLLGGCASSSSPCPTFATFAQQVERDKRDGFPMAYTLQHYQLQMVGDAQRMRSVAAIVKGVYLHGENSKFVQNKCEAGEYAPKKP